MNKYYLLLIISVLFLTGCSKNNNAPAGNDQFTIVQYAEKAVHGDKFANDSLSGLIDFSLPINGIYNKLTVQKYNDSRGKSYYAVLLEYSNPLYNRFAVYDSLLNPLVIDKSLNGRLSMKQQKFNGRDYLEVTEVFLSKDVLELNRISLYEINNGAALAARLFTKFAAPQNKWYQEITEFTADRIKTDIKSDKNSSLQGKSDIFSYNETVKMYTSEADIFSKFIKEYIASIKKVTEKPEITNERSALQSVGISTEADTITNTSNISKKAGYYLTLTEGWKEIKDVVIAGYSISPLQGTRYENNYLGAKLFVINLNHHPAETYFTQVFSKESGTSAKVRYTDKMESKKYYLQLFEYSCSSNKYVLIFEASKFTYDEHKKEYEDIINSFSMDCD